MCSHYTAHGLCTDFPDWAIASVGTESLLKIGYDYARLVTGVEHQIEPDLVEESMSIESDVDQVVPDPLEEKTMVATSAEVHEAIFTYLFCLV